MYVYERIKPVEKRSREEGNKVVSREMLTRMLVWDEINNRREMVDLDG